MGRRTPIGMQRFITYVITCVIVMSFAFIASPVRATSDWTAPTDLSATGGNASSPQIASSSDGTKLTAIWSRYDGNRDIIQAASSSDSGASWSTAINLSVAGQHASAPQIATSADGTRLAATWRRYNGSNWIIQATSSTTSGTTWTTPTDLSATGRDAYFPQIASSSDGTKLTAIWERNNGSNWIIQTKSSTDGGLTWTTPTDLSATGRNASSPQIASSSDGTKLTAIWYRYDGSNWIIQTKSSTDGGLTWTAVPINLSATGGSAFNPQIASSSDGTKLTAIWERNNGTNNIVQAASSTTSGTTWTAPTNLSDSGEDAYSPQIASSSDGTKLTAIWYRYDGNRDIIQAASSSDSGASWSTAINLSVAGGNASSPRIASSSDGTKLTAIWERNNGSNLIIQAASSTTSGTTWTAPTDLSVAGGNAYFPQIASSSDGTKLTAIWHRNNGTNNIVQTRGLRPTPTPSPTPTATPIVSLHHADLDPAGGSCVIHGEVATLASPTPFLGYTYIPGAEECRRSGYTFQGWASRTKPDDVIPLPLLRGWDDGVWRYFIANTVDLVAVWKPTS